MSEIDPEKILAELEAARLARQQSGGAFPVRYRALLITFAVMITLLLLALFAFSLIPAGEPGSRPTRHGPTEAAAPMANGIRFALTSRLPNRLQLPKVVTGNRPTPPFSDFH